MKRILPFILLFLVLIAIDQFWIKREKMTSEKKLMDLTAKTEQTSEARQKKAGKKKEIVESIPAKEKPAPELSLPEKSVPERLSELGAHIGDPVYIRIFKYAAELEMWIKTGDHYTLLHTYTICRQSGYLGPKQKEGDRQGPEGFYYVTKGRLNPNSRFHLSFNLGYPNRYDRAHHRTGSALMVHGDCVSIGCFAMTDEKIEEIYELVEEALENGQKYVRVHIFPFRMTEERMQQYRFSQWYDFWSNLKEGYDYFEENGIPPDVGVKRKKYVFK